MRFATFRTANVNIVWYDSPSLKLQRRMYVYTPAGYDTGQQRYPVLYLLRGAGGDEDAWNNMGRASVILDNLIAAGKAKPMLVVMTNGNANQKTAPGYGIIPMPFPSAFCVKIAGAVDSICRLPVARATPLPFTATVAGPADIPAGTRKLICCEDT